MSNKVTAGDAVSALGQGISLSFNDKELGGLVLKATLVNAIAYVVFMVALLWGTLWATGALLSGSWYFDLLGWLIRIVVLISVFFMAPVLFMLVAAIVLPFFRMRIFRRTRAAHGVGDLDAPGGVMQEAKLAGLEVRRLIRFLMISLLLLPLHLVPVIGSLTYLVLQTLLVSRTMAWDLMSYHFEIHQVRYKDQKAWLKNNSFAMLSLGFCATLLCMVPFAQFLFLSTNVVGAGIVSAAIDGPTPPTTG